MAYDYNKGVVNNGDSTGTITFTVPYDAPNTLYYVADNNSIMGGRLNIVNSSATPRYLIANTLTYPATIFSSSLASTNVDKINAYDLLIQNKALELSLFLSIPAAIALLIASEEIISSLFGYGSFDEESVKNSSKALFYFAIGLPAFSLIKVFSTFFFANHDTSRQFKIMRFCVVFNHRYQLVSM